MSCFRLLAILSVVLSFSVGCTADQHSHDAHRDVRAHILALEKQVDQHPESIGPSLNLSLLYGLSVQLDDQLTLDVKKERAARSVALARWFYDAEVSAPQVDIEKALHVGFILAQNYLSIGSNELAWAVFDELTASFGKKPTTLEDIATARKRLVDRVNQGYPFDAENPWVVGFTFTPLNAKTNATSATLPDHQSSLRGGVVAEDGF